MPQTQTAAPDGPLSGLRVLDVGAWLAGPVAATLMAEFGAEVIKVEPPGQGDGLRVAGPKVNGVGCWWMTDARNKKCITLNLAHPEGQSLLKELVRRSDVLVENYRPGTMERLGLGYEELRAVNPRLVMLRASGFGQTGPYRDKAGYDRVGAGYAGLTYLTGYPDRAPVRPGVAIVDYLAAYNGLVGVLMALYRRDAAGDGEGQWVEATLTESVFRVLEWTAPAYHHLGTVRERMGNKNPTGAPADNFQARDGGWITMYVVGDRQWERFCRLVGREDLLQDPGYATQDDRAERLDEINRIGAEWIAGMDRDEAIATLQDAGLAAGPVNSIADIFRDPHFQARGDFVMVDVPGVGPTPLPSVTPRLSRTPGAVRWAGPSLGEHNEQVYGGLLGLSSAELQRLQAEGVI